MKKGYELEILDCDQDDYVHELLPVARADADEWTLGKRKDEIVLWHGGQRIVVNGRELINAIKELLYETT